jgi:HEAT repeat protein
MAFTMAKKRSPQAVPQLLKLAYDNKENPLIRASAVGYLGLFPAKVPPAVLSRFAFDTDPMVRVEAGRALGLAGDQSVVPILLRLAEDPYRTVRVNAAAAIVNLSLQDKAPRLDPAALPKFEKAIGEYRRSLEVEGDHPQIQVQLGDLELYADRIKEARGAYEAALRRDPRNARAYLGLAFVEVAEGNKESAVRNAARAAELSNDPHVKEILKRLNP